MPAEVGDVDAGRDRRLHGIEFDELYTITNMPISRYLEWLERTDNLAEYMEKLVAAFGKLEKEFKILKSLA